MVYYARNTWVCAFVCLCVYLIFGTKLTVHYVSLLGLSVAVSFEHLKLRDQCCSPKNCAYPPPPPLCHILQPGNLLIVVLFTQNILMLIYFAMKNLYL